MARLPQFFADETFDVGPIGPVSLVGIYPMQYFTSLSTWSWKTNPPCELAQRRTIDTFAQDHITSSFS